MVGWVGDKVEDLSLTLFCDANFAGDKEDARSTSGGWLVLTGPNTSFPLSWLSRKQTSTARSTTESEVVALAAGLFSEALPVLSLFERAMQKKMRLNIMEDNQSTIRIVKSGYSAKLRHVNRVHEVDLSSIKEQLEDGYIEIQYVDTCNQAADLFTKALEPQKWGPALHMLNIIVRPRTDTSTKTSKGELD